MSLKVYKTTEELNKIITREFLEENLTNKSLYYSDIAKIVGCDSGTIISRTKKFNIILTRKWNKILTKEFLQTKVNSKNFSSVKIAKEIGCDVGRVKEYLIKFGLPQTYSEKLDRLITKEFLLKYITPNGTIPCDKIVKETGYDLWTIKQRVLKFGLSIRTISEALKGKPHSKKWCENIRKSYLYSNKQRLKNRNNKNYIQGNYTSIKNNCNIKFDSSYELRVYIKLEKDSQVKYYRRCSFGIPYLRDKEIHYYIPDLEIEYKNGNKIILEVKPLNHLKELEGKKEAAKKYCQKHNWKYIIWTEKDIKEISEIKSQEEVLKFLEIYSKL